MSFYDELQTYTGFDFSGFFAGLTDEKITGIIARDRLTALDYLALLSPRAEAYLEMMARRAHELTVRNFGRTVLLYTPMYLANYCVNQCVYCGFHAGNKLPRKKLTLAEVAAEAEIIAATGLKHILILTGESATHSPVTYLLDCVQVLKKYFTCIGLEVYPLSQTDYERLIAAGVDGLTIYQEVYDQAIYLELHPAGPKRDFRHRLETPERACAAGMRTVNVGALLGLNDWRTEAFFSGLHADYLQRNYPAAEVSISPPRMRPHLGGFPPRVIVSDRNIVQYIVAFRLFMPRAGITVSTRERADFRNNLLQLGVTKMSAGSCTAVGGRTHPEEIGQFDISDSRGVGEMATMLYKRGYQPVYKDWQLW